MAIEYDPELGEAGEVRPWRPWPLIEQVILSALTAWLLVGTACAVLTTLGIAF